MKNLSSAPAQEMACFVLIGGFLGAGKTTCLGALIKHYQGLGRRVGVITNDQGVGLVDTRRLSFKQAATSFEPTELGEGGTTNVVAGRGGNSSLREITGGCFCCRAGELVSALEALAKEWV